MNQPQSAILLGLLLTHAVHSPSLGADEPRRTHTITVDDFFSVAHLSEVAISPDGDFVAYSDARWQESTNDRKSDIWVVSAKTGGPCRLTFDRAGYNSIHWSPDSKFLYFMGNRKREGRAGPGYDGTTQVW